jgi:hypothetical protein
MISHDFTSLAVRNPPTTRLPEIRNSDTQYNTQYNTIRNTQHAIVHQSRRELLEPSKLVGRSWNRSWIGPTKPCAPVMSERRGWLGNSRTARVAVDLGRSGSIWGRVVSCSESEALCSQLSCDIHQNIAKAAGWSHGI